MPARDAPQTRAPTSRSLVSRGMVIRTLVSRILAKRTLAPRISMMRARLSRVMAVRAPARVQLALTLACLAGTGACAPYGRITRAEDDLALAGFSAHAADTTARYALMNLLPPNRMAYRMRGPDAVLLYADPLACGCVYMGDRQAYAAWVARHRTTPLQERQMTAEILQHPGWDWSVWAPTADPPGVRALHGLP